jgi:MFS family permease
VNRSPAGLWTGRYVSLLGSTFIAYVGFQMLVPTLTAYIKAIGGTTLSAGLVYSVAAFAALLARCAFGTTMDRIGRWPVLLAGAVVLTVTDLLLFTGSNIAVICLLRFCQGIGWGMASTALATIASDMIPTSRLGEGIGYFALSIVLATSLSIVVGVSLMTACGFAVMLATSAIFFIAALVLFLRIGKVPFRRDEQADASLWQSLFERRAVLPAALCFLHSVAFSGIITFIMMFGHESGIRNVAVYFIGHVTMVLLSRPIVGKIYDRKGHSAVIVPGVLAMIAGLLLLSYAHDLPHLILASLFYGLGFGTVQPSLQAWAIARSPVHRRGAANGTFLSSLDLGYAVGAIVTGAVAAATSYAMMYRLSTVLLVVFLAIYAGLALNERHRARS